MERFASAGDIGRFEHDRREEEYWADVKETTCRIALGRGFSAFDADDIAQNVCRKMARRHGPEVHAEPPAPLVQHIARRAIVDEWRRTGRRITSRSLDEQLYGDGRTLADVVAAPDGPDEPDLPSGEALVAAIQDAASDWIGSVRALTELERSGAVSPITALLIRGRLLAPATWIANRIGVGEPQVELVLRVHGPSALFALEPEGIEPIEILATRAGLSDAAARQRLRRIHKAPELTRIVRLMVPPHTRAANVT